MPLLRYIERSHRISILALGIALALPLPALGQAPESLELEADSMPLPSGDVLPGASMGAAGGQEHSPLPESYVLGPGDRIRVDIFNVPEFSGPDNGVHEVLIDGTLSLPMVGILEVRGLTLKQTRQLLAAEYSRLLTRPPYLTVTLLSSRPVRIAVSGEVNRPGTVQIPANTTLNQAILAAGGFSDSRAKTSTVELVRLNSDGTVERRSLEVDLSIAANEETNPILRPNDVVMVDRNAVARTGDTLGLILNPITAVGALLRIFGFGF